MLVYVQHCVGVTQVSEMAVSELPGNPNAVWTVKRNTEGEPGCLSIQGFLQPCHFSFIFCVFVKCIRNIIFEIGSSSCY